MKFVGDVISFSRVNPVEATHTVRLPVYHRAAVGLFPGTRVFAVPRPSTNEVILSPIDPASWGDLWRLEATVLDKPGTAKALVETLVANDVNVLVHEGLSESIENGQTVHQVHEILDLAKYSDRLDGTSDQRNSVNRPLLKPNRLISKLIEHGAECLTQTRGQDGWELKFTRMEFFFRNKEFRAHGVELNLNIHNEIHVPTQLVRAMSFVDDDLGQPLALHIISDTEQKYVKLRILSPLRYYLLLEIEHDERVGAIDEFMRMLRDHGANMIDSYSRLQSIAQSALFYALCEFATVPNGQHVLQIVNELLESRVARSVVLKGAFGAGPDPHELALPAGALVRTRRRTKSVQLTDVPKPDVPPVATRGGLGLPYYLDRRGSGSWTLKTAEVFMAIPFADDYEEFYNEFIASAVQDAGLDPVRVDQVPQEAQRRPLIDRIEEGIARARFVIADVSGWNPNVIYEVGLAAGISKPLLMLCHSRHFEEADIPFDFRAYELVEYSPYKPSDFKKRLQRKIHEMRDVT
jgi:hypothetical protein